MTFWNSPTRSLALKLTRFFSQTETEGEKDFAPFLLKILSDWPYFAQNPNHLRLAPTVNDPFERYLAMALVRGRGPQTLILTGHYDVVGIDNYASLSEWACAPEDLLPRLIAELERESGLDGGLQPADSQALADLRSGLYLPGRGLLDMKCGLAAGLAVLERFAALPLEARQGNLLFIAVPDEEIASNGARTAALGLPDLAEEWGLHLSGLINLDASNDHGEESLGQAAYLGSIGKLLPSVYFVGREAHAGSPFSGVNATLLAAEMTRRVECAPELADSLDGEYTAPPTCLKQTDNKTHYDVTTPKAAWCYYNWLVLRKPVEDVLETVKALAFQSVESALAAQRSAAERYLQAANRADTLPDWQAQVYTFAEVKAAAVRRCGVEFCLKLNELEHKLAENPGIDAPTCSMRLTEAAWEASGLSGPSAVVGFAALYYAPAFLGQSSEESALRAAIQRQAAGLSAEKDTPIYLRPFFPGISDMSFFSGRVTPLSRSALSANSPAWEQRTGFEYAAESGINLPSANIGPWGRDYHQRTERVFTPYSFEILPELLWRIAADFLAAKPS